MDLRQLMDYYQQVSIDNNTWASVNHDWMVNNIDLMARYLSLYVQEFYPNIYNPYVGLDPYKYQMYKGLEGSRFYQQNINYIDSLKEYIRDLMTKDCPQ